MLLQRCSEASMEEGAALPTSMCESLGSKLTFLQPHGIYLHTGLLTSVTFAFPIDPALLWASKLTFPVRIEQ